VQDTKSLVIEMILIYIVMDHTALLQYFIVAKLN